MRQSSNAIGTARLRYLGSGTKRSMTRSGPRAASGYLRQRDLPRLLPVFPEEIDANSVRDHARLVALLRRALRIERYRGLNGDWSYDLARHASLLEAYRFELDALEARRRRVPPPSAPKLD